MLIIDPNLHNPTINGMQLIVNNRINPKIALAQEDIYGADGVIVEKFQDGTIMISADINSINHGEYKNPRCPLFSGQWYHPHWAGEAPGSPAYQ